MDAKGDYLFRTCSKQKLLPIFPRPQVGKFWGKVGMVGFIIVARIQSLPFLAFLFGKSSSARFG